ncbi:class I adenylate-forming enzyme family protein [Streptomyces turgidiscabies]|uniref:AMP-binding enzyme n=2 Tax=Streptomyces turgidiscabies TaxID=85558 RepID=L7FI11_STRT8|nr:MULTISPECIES: AMP-binding protein [Streptomyces]ELP70691.1 AMP-binding enzyme [Streptomyces turgidiscabies Car8]MDX3496009.1 AMP-binding protein [Streptomyces turgidiscabies]GAQ72502.1 long-chain-fatty-acid--CoA ligase [Streptomyces turgidiscabies]
MTAPPLLLHDLLDQAAERAPRSVALSTSGARLTYHESARASVRLAGRLHEAGVRRGDRVVVSASDSLGTALLVYAVSRLGAVFSILHEDVRGGPLEHVLRDCEPVLLVSDAPDAGRTAAAHQVSCLTIAELVRDALDGSATSPAPSTPEALTVDPVCLIYTSGTTSLPKAVVSTHQQVLFSASAIQACLNYRDDDIVFCPLPLSFDYGLYQLYLAALSGAQLHLGATAEVGPLLLRNLEQTGATVLPGVPSVSDRLAWLLGRSSGTEPLRRLRLLTNTGAALSESTMSALRRALPHLRVQVMYGLTECKRAAIMPPDGDLEHPGSCGYPLPGTQIHVIDDDGRRLPPGEVGQIVVRGPNVMAGYWRRPDLDAERFFRAEGLFPELRTGDYGWLDDQGFLYFAGRRDDLYKERGFRISATEVEAAAHRVEGVTSAAVLTPHGQRGAVLAVVVDAVEAEAVRDRMREHIEPFKIPRRCVRLDALPTNGNGKVDRKKLAALLDRSGTATATATDK